MQKKTSSPTPPIGVLERGISILECFNENQLRLNLNEIAKETGLNKATLLRLLNVLTQARMIYRDENGTYSPGASLLHMGMLYRSTFNLGERIQPILLNVMQKTGETVAFYVRNGEDRICLYRENTNKELRHHVEAGTRIALKDGGSSAHILKAYTGDDSSLSQTIRTKGFAITRSERIAGMASVALPVSEGGNNFLGALVVIGLASRFNMDAQKKAIDIAQKELRKYDLDTATRDNPKS
jgi:DNA-binding IclR family transcriptional regulator